MLGIRPVRSLPVVAATLVLSRRQGFARLAAVGGNELLAGRAACVSAAFQKRRLRFRDHERQRTSHADPYAGLDLEAKIQAWPTQLGNQLAHQVFPERFFCPTRATLARAGVLLRQVRGKGGLRARSEARCVGCQQPGHHIVRHRRLIEVQHSCGEEANGRVLIVQIKIQYRV